MNNTKICPLLDDRIEYEPDTINLSTDLEARTYWLDCFQQMVKKFAVQAVASHQSDETAPKRSRQFQDDVNNAIETICESNEPLSIRILLDLNDKYLRLNGFPDPWYNEKQRETARSITSLPERLEQLDRLDGRTKWIELVKGVLAGNVFDWGAQAVSEILAENKSFGLTDAIEQVQIRPWLIDGLDEWLTRMEGVPHRCATIFVDNSGVDFVLGIIPFVRELLIRDTKIILCANRQPSLNDITVDELHQVLDEISLHCPVIKSAIVNQMVIVCDNGQNGPCLDMRRISSELHDAIITNESDLLVIEGMARALHTNLRATFKCETLKLAVIKNKWLANRLGGDTFSIICKYESI